jgi:hypothetical protein
MDERPDALDALRRYAHRLRAEAPARPEVVLADVAVPAGRSSLRVLALAATLFVLAFASLAAVADDSVPGDLLHPFDRAGEWVVDLTPWGADRSAERLAEVEVLVDRGDLGRALAALERVAEQAAEDRADVADLLAAIEEMQAVQETDGPRGEEVRLIARTLGSLVGRGNQPDPAGPPEDPGQGIPPETRARAAHPRTRARAAHPRTRARAAHPRTRGGDREAAGPRPLLEGS